MLEVWPALSGLSWVRSGLLLLEVHVLAFAEEHERDQGDYGHRAQVPAKRLDAEVHDQGQRDGGANAPSVMAARL